MSFVPVGKMEYTFSADVINKQGQGSSHSVQSSPALELQQQPLVLTPSKDLCILERVELFPLAFMIIPLVQWKQIQFALNDRCHVACKPQTFVALIACLLN